MTPSSDGIPVEIVNDAFLKFLEFWDGTLARQGPVLQHVDRAGKGRVHLHEFLAATVCARCGRDVTRQAFDTLDKAGSGSLNLSVFTSSLEQQQVLGFQEKAAVDIREMLGPLFEDHSRITYDDFACF